MESLLGLPVWEKYKELDVKNVPLNHAYVFINTTIDDVGVYSLPDNCHNCPFKREEHVKADYAFWLVDTSVQKTWRMLNHGDHVILPTNAQSGLLCEMRPSIGEYGVYQLDPGRCDAKEMVAPVNSYNPLLLFSALVLVLYIIYGFIKFLKRKSSQSNIVLKIDTEKNLQLDTVQLFRGIIMSLLIFATVGGGGYPLFNVHIGGLSTADIIFFIYTWTIGVYAPIFAENERKLGKSKWNVIKEILLRAIVLTLLGTLIDSTVQSTANPVSLWWPLQRIGVAYFVVVTSYVLTVQNFEIKSKKFICKVAENLVSLLWCWIFGGFLLVIMIGLISTFISFNCTADMDPKDTHVDHSGLTMAAPRNCNNAFTEYVNVLFVGSTQRFININFYFGICRGILGMMSTILMTMIGLKTGFIFVRYNTNYERVRLWLTWATIFFIGAGIFVWISYPLRFNLWPVASIIAMSSVALFAFILLYTVTEILSFPKLLLKQTGQASIAIFTGHLLFSQSIPFNWNIPLNSHYLLILQNTWTVLLWTMVALILVKKNFKISL